MRRALWIPPVSIAAAALLLLSSCATDDATDVPGAEVASPEGEPTSGPSDASEARAEPEEQESTAPEGAPETEQEDGPETFEPRGGQRLVDGPDGVEFFHISADDDDGSEVHHLQCRDDQALAEKAAHNAGAQPVGWPQEWDASGAMPDPLCHPDYLEIAEWEHLEAHSACWEGTETSTLAAGGQTQEEVDEFLWQQSQARSDWEPNPPGGNCAEQWAEHSGGDPEDYEHRGNADDG